MIGRRGVTTIGLVGGIGAGKSAVARELAALGWVVSDADAHAQAVLDRPRVRRRLIRWWGDRVLSRGGRIDRAAVSAIVFADEVERRRLEALIHPTLRRALARERRRARRSGAPGLVIDAPLLMEANLEGECDVLVYVDAPVEARRRRVQADRGWSAGELERREAAQLPLKQKRSRADIIITNDASPEVLRERVHGMIRGELGAAGKGRSERKARNRA